ncbi:MAG: hypothetical protein U9R50_03250 [Campylobacterota bacterium]|nr:hypothetical protein [Campylobacterota bacterium]
MSDKQVEFQSSFVKQRQKLTSSKQLTDIQIDDTLHLYIKNKNTRNLHKHKITCKHDKCRISIAVLNTGQKYKILLSDQADRVVFIFIGSHKRYDRINKDC